ncbi:hypothetical protein ACFRQM_24635 [Streptomyces sp. NPDC056831]|uniref:hypothetical protein n=1 Tax=Streptomyces sp. NPDC056831 TaxID=3345954 RepID=UPI003691104C
MSNTQNLAGIRCPKCFNETAFVVQMTMNVVMFDDGISFLGVSQPDNDHFQGRVIPDDDGFRDEDPIECYMRRDGCGHWGTVRDFRTNATTAA